MVPIRAEVAPRPSTGRSGDPDFWRPAGSGWNGTAACEPTEEYGSEPLKVQGKGSTGPTVRRSWGVRLRRSK